MFEYRHDQLFCEDVSLKEIADAVGTPTYVYSASALLERANAYQDSLAEGLVCYAVKANGNLNILRLLARHGFGADVTSGGELYLAIKGGIPAERIIFSGVGKRRDELLMAMELGIKAIHIESAFELETIQSLAKESGMPASVSVRVNPDISADTHPYDSTGELGHKFGVPREIAFDLYRAIAADPNLKAVGLAAHIGSQITSLEPYRQLGVTLTQIAVELQEEGISLSYIDMGGGLGINYQGDDAPEIADWVTAVSQPAIAAGYEVVLEPGRSIVAPVGILLASVTATKRQGGKSFVIVDAGMNDLIRPAMYGAYHPCELVLLADGEREVVDIVGPICETGDFLAKERLLPALHAGDLLAFRQAGAYGFAMSSNYNGRLRAAEVVVQGDEFRVVRKRQVYEDLLNGIVELG